MYVVLAVTLTVHDLNSVADQLTVVCICECIVRYGIVADWFVFFVFVFKIDFVKGGLQWEFVLNSNDNKKEKKKKKRKKKKLSPIEII